MTGIDADRVQRQLDEWRTKLDTLRVKAHLFKLEYQDKPQEAQEHLEHAFAEAKAKFAEFQKASGHEASRIGASFHAAWEAFRDKYESMTGSRHD